MLESRIPLEDLDVDELRLWDSCMAQSLPASVAASTSTGNAADRAADFADAVVLERRVRWKGKRVAP